MFFEQLLVSLLANLDYISCLSFKLAFLIIFVNKKDG